MAPAGMARGEALDVLQARDILRACRRLGLSQADLYAGYAEQIAHHRPG
jgi:hypothetical protein